MNVRRSLATKLAIRVGLPFLALSAVLVLCLRVPPAAAWAAIVFPVAGVVAYTIALRLLLSGELGRLTRAMERAESGDFITRADAEGGDEVAELAGRFN